MMREPTLPAYVWAKSGRRGQRMLYFRFTCAGRKTYVRLPDDPVSPDFHARYAELLAQMRAKPKLTRPAADTIAGLIAAYRAAPEYTRLARNTRVYTARLLDRLAPLATFPAAALSRAHVIKLRNRLSH